MMAFFRVWHPYGHLRLFQGIGQPTKALIIPLVRQGIVLIPLALLLSARSAWTVRCWPFPVADLTSFVISVVLVKGEFSPGGENRDGFKFAAPYSHTYRNNTI